MTTASLHYGNFDRPAEKKQLHLAQEEPVALATTLFQQWMPVASATSDLRAAYDEAYSLLSPYSETFGSLDQDDLEKILQTVEQSGSKFSGYFISAFHNATPITTIRRAFPVSCDGVGYRLEAGKTLVVGKNSTIREAGAFAKGTVINHGTLERLATATEGIVVNFGSTRYLGLVLKGATLINFGSVYQVEGIKNSFILNFGEANYFSRHCSRSFALNFGTAFEFAYGLLNSIALNYGEAGSMGGNCQNSILVNLAKKKHMRKFGDNTEDNVNMNAGPSHFVYNAVNFSRNVAGVDIALNSHGLTNRFRRPIQGAYAADGHARALVGKAKELRRFGKLEKHPDKAAGTLAQFNWMEYAAEMKRIAEQHVAVRK